MAVHTIQVFQWKLIKKKEKTKKNSLSIAEGRPIVLFYTFLWCAFYRILQRSLCTICSDPFLSQSFAKQKCQPMLPRICIDIEDERVIWWVGELRTDPLISSDSWAHSRTLRSVEIQADTPFEMSYHYSAYIFATNIACLTAPRKRKCRRGTARIIKKRSTVTLISCWFMKVNMGRILSTLKRRCIGHLASTTS